MRKVEYNMLQAIHAGKSWSGGNTSVSILWDGAVEVRLHGNLIFRRGADGLVRFSLAGWPTATTRSRLSALLRDRGHAVGQANGVQYARPLPGAVGARVELRPQGWYTVRRPGVVLA